MKKIISLSLVLLVLLSCLTSCNFHSNVSGALAGDGEATPKVEEMLELLAEDRLSDAKELMHPDVSEKSDAALEQMKTYLSGRVADSVELQSINVNNSTSTAAGKTRQESVTYKVTLSDEEVIYLSVVYLSDKNGDGFVSFQIVLGII